jgi:hypothetical protein
MFPQYYTSAGSGGRMSFTQGKSNKPEQTASMRQKMDDYIKTYKMTPDKAHEAAYKEIYGNNSKEDVQNPNGYPGAVKAQAGGFLYGNQTYPFIY